MELFDVGLWGLCMALCVWVGAVMGGAGGGPARWGGRGGGNSGGHLGFSTLCLAVQGAGAELLIAPSRREFFI